MQLLVTVLFNFPHNQDKSVKDVSLKKMEERDKKKMDQLKKKLHTDDEGTYTFFNRLIDGDTTCRACQLHVHVPCGLI